MRLINKIETKTSGGILSKAWYEHNGVKYLIKGNSKNHLEPYSEVIASRIGMMLGIPVEEYFIVKSKDFKEIKGFNGIKHFSACGSYMEGINGQSIPAGIYMDSTSNKNIKDYWWYYINRSNLSIDFLYKMIILDAFIGNTDRHLNNWDIIIDDKGNVFNAPLIDNGNSLLAGYSMLELKRNFKLGPDKSKPFSDTHTKQVHLLKRDLGERKYINYISRDDLVVEIERLNSDILSILGKERKRLILKYLYNRYHYIKGIMA